MKRNIISDWNLCSLTLAIFILASFIPDHASAQSGLLYSGQLERGYPKAQNINTPYYPSSFQKGSVTYHGYTYEDVSLKADLATGQLIILSPATGYSLTYAPQELDQIILNGMELCYLEKPSAGWYEVLARGNDWVLYRQNYISNSSRETQGNVMLTRYSLSQRIYLFKQEEWVPISGFNAFCKQFKEYKALLQSYAKQQGLKLNAQDLEGWKQLGEHLNKIMR